MCYKRVQNFRVHSSFTGQYSSTEDFITFTNVSSHQLPFSHNYFLSCFVANNMAPTKFTILEKKHMPVPRFEPRTPTMIQNVHTV